MKNSKKKCQAVSVPYTYLIKNKTSGMFYYGVRVAIGCSPSDLWVTYFTSSKVVKEVIKEYGREDFEVEIRKTFKTKEDAIKHEHKVLRRLGAHKRNDFMNKCAYPAIIKPDKYIVIHNVLTNKIKHHDVTKEMPENFVCGFPPTFKRGSSLGGFYYNDGIVNKIVRLGEEIPPNFVRGKITKRHRWATDGIMEYKISISEELPEGFRYGRLSVEHLREYLYVSGVGGANTAKNTVWINNGIIERKIKVGEEIPKNYKLGRLEGKCLNSTTFLGMRSYNNGVIEIKLNDENKVPEGFVRGGRRRKRNAVP